MTAKPFCELSYYNKWKKLNSFQVLLKSCNSKTAQCSQMQACCKQKIKFDTYLLLLSLLLNNNDCHIHVPPFCQLILFQRHSITVDIEWSRNKVSAQ